MDTGSTNSVDCEQLALHQQPERLNQARRSQALQQTRQTRGEVDLLAKVIDLNCECRKDG
jgi:hypothetical protein